LISQSRGLGDVYKRQEINGQFARAALFLWVASKL
jgi:hypothetical protein